MTTVKHASQNSLKKIYFFSYTTIDNISQIHQCDFAILLVSGNFLYSDYIKQEEFSAFLERQRQEGFLFFPIMVGPCDLNQWQELGERQFFKPAGDNYGRPDKKDFTYADLVKQRETDGQLLLNPDRDRYHEDLVKALEGAMEKCTALRNSNSNFGKITGVHGGTPLHNLPIGNRYCFG